jgi:glycopeptide antibiotics resistance protein
MKTNKTLWLTRILFVIYLFVLIGIILFKLPFYSARFTLATRVINLVPLQGSFDDQGALMTKEIAFNIILFIPLGIYLCLLKKSWSWQKKVLAVVGLTTTLELVQFIFALGITDITDVLNNTLGGIIGIITTTLFARFLKTKTTTIVNLLALILTVVAMTHFTYLFYLSHFVMQH